MAVPGRDPDPPCSDVLECASPSTACKEGDSARSVDTSALRPAGKGRFGAKKYDIVTRGEFIDSGTPVRIIESSGNRYVVTAIEAKDDVEA